MSTDSTSSQTEIDWLALGVTATFIMGAGYAGHKLGLTKITLPTAKSFVMPLAFLGLVPTANFIPHTDKDAMTWAFPVLLSKGVTYTAAAMAHNQWGIMGKLPFLAMLVTKEVGAPYEYTMEDGQVCRDVVNCVKHTITSTPLLAILGAEAVLGTYYLGAFSSGYLMAGTLFLSRAFNIYQKLPSDHPYKQIPGEIVDHLPKRDLLSNLQIKSNLESAYHILEQIVSSSPISMSAVGIGALFTTALAATVMTASAITHYGEKVATWMMANPYLMGEVPESLHGMMVLAWMPFATVSGIALTSIMSDMFSAAQITSSMGRALLGGACLEAALLYKMGFHTSTILSVIGATELTLVGMTYYNHLPSDHTLKAPISWLQDTGHWLYEQLPSLSSEQKYVVEHDVV